MIIALRRSQDSKGRGEDGEAEDRGGEKMHLVSVLGVSSAGSEDGDEIPGRVRQRGSIFIHCLHFRSN